MARAKKSKTATKKRVNKKVEETPYSPKRYEVEIYKKSQPVDKLAGRFGYWESTNELKILEYKDNFGADVEDLLIGDIMVNGVGISVNNDRKNWIKNLCNTELGFKFYATTARELNETE
jgi:hypothetical protein